MTPKDQVRTLYPYAAPVEEYAGWIIRDMSTSKTISGTYPSIEQAWSDAQERTMNSEANEQSVLNAAVSEDERLYVAEPLPIPTISVMQKQKLAYDIWEANGAVENDPLTLNNFLEAEVILESQSPLSEPTE